jgi:hypothetical protein
VVPSVAVLHITAIAPTACPEELDAVLLPPVDTRPNPVWCWAIAPSPGMTRAWANPLPAETFGQLVVHGPDLYQRRSRTSMVPSRRRTW